MQRRVAGASVEYVFMHPPKEPVVRIGKRHTDLWQPKGWNHYRRLPDGTFGYRFDDPGRMHKPPIPEDLMLRMIYCASDLVGAVCEVAAGRRPPTRELARKSRQPLKGVMDEDWCSGRAAGYTLLDADLLFVNLASHQTANALSEVPNIAR